MNMQKWFLYDIDDCDIVSLPEKVSNKSLLPFYNSIKTSKLRFIESHPFLQTFSKKIESSAVKQIDSKDLYY